VKLVLFDIDGTILLTDGAGRRAVHRALMEVFGSTGTADHRFDGKTDPQIVRELMRLLSRYVEFLHEELQSGVTSTRLMKGVRELLDALDSRDDVLLGLLTGNLAEGARAKLGAAGIDPARFRVGAFGSDHEARGELPGVAQRRARDELGFDIAGSDVVVIGDTPADIQCGRAIGARAIGVATGHYSAEELARHHPAAVFEDLSSTDEVIRVIVADSVASSERR
jgi:phosphoglycolate phosphatase-like HAD superfamily hydrolase